MAELEINTKVTGPDEIDVRLVRYDFLYTSNIFRTFFEIFLAFTAALIGVILSVTQITPLHWIFLLVVGVSMFSFLILSIIFHNKCKKGKI